MEVYYDVSGAGTVVWVKCFLTFVLSCAGPIKSAKRRDASRRQFEHFVRLLFDLDLSS